MSIRIAGALTILAMSVALVVGTIQSQPGDLATLVSNPWSRAVMVDLYLALGLFALWIVRRHGALRAAPWILLLVVGGSIAAGLYLLWSAGNDGGEARSSE